jgi:hypothetical protein
MAMMVGALLFWSPFVGAQTTGDHLECRRIRDPLRLRGPAGRPPPAWLDLNGDQCRIVGSFRLLCRPVTKTVTQPLERRLSPPGGSWEDFVPAPLGSSDTLAQAKLCYRIRCAPETEITRAVQDQFATRSVEIDDPYLLCGPADEAVCGDGNVDPFEDCDAPDDSACPGRCTSDCRCLCGGTPPNCYGSTGVCGTGMLCVDLGGACGCGPPPP